MRYCVQIHINGNAVLQDFVSDTNREKVLKSITSNIGDFLDFSLKQLPETHRSRIVINAYEVAEEIDNGIWGGGDAEW